jgi:phage terminase large subunit-like protein
MRVMTGSKPVVVIVDELHVMSAYSYASRVIGQIRGGLLPNPESLLIFITTQSDQPPAGVFKAELGYARGVRDGTITERVRMLPVLYEFPETMQTDKSAPWRDPSNWPMVLPNLGRSITIERLTDDYIAAREKGEEEERRWASQHLNVEIGLALHADRWRGADYWLAASDTSLTLETLIERSEVITIGIDGGGLDDLFGMAVLGRCRKTRHWLLWNRAWVHDDVLDKRKDIAERLMDFEAAGDLIICKNPTDDFREAAAIAQRIWSTGLLPKKDGIGLDPAGMLDTPAELGFCGGLDEVAAFVTQGYKHSGRAWTLERKLKDKTLRHSGSAMMAWCVGNAKVVQQGNAIKIDKEVAGKAKIDPLIASFNAVELLGRNPVSANAEDTIDVYDGYEVITL